MHSFALLLGDILAHDYAKSVSRDAQRIATYILGSSKPLHELRSLIKQLQIKGGGLVTGNKTRFNSVLLVRGEGGGGWRMREVN